MSIKKKTHPNNIFRWVSSMFNFAFYNFTPDNLLISSFDNII